VFTYIHTQTDTGQTIRVFAVTNIKGKIIWIYIAPSRETWLSGTDHSFSFKQYNNARLYLVSIHQMARPLTVSQTSNCSLLLIYLPRKDERMSRPSWLTYSGRFTHISGHPSAAGRAQDKESSPIKHRRTTTGR